MDKTNIYNLHLIREANNHRLSIYSEHFSKLPETIANEKSFLEPLKKMKENKILLMEGQYYSTKVELLT